MSQRYGEPRMTEAVAGLLDDNGLIELLASRLQKLRLVETACIKACTERSDEITRLRLKNLEAEMKLFDGTAEKRRMMDRICELQRHVCDLTAEVEDLHYVLGRERLNTRCMMRDLHNAAAAQDGAGNLNAEDTERLPSVVEEEPELETLGAPIRPPSPPRPVQHPTTDSPPGAGGWTLCGDSLI